MNTPHTDLPAAVRRSGVARSTWLTVVVVTAALVGAWLRQRHVVGPPADTSKMTSSLAHQSAVHPVQRDRSVPSSDAAFAGDARLADAIRDHATDVNVLGGGRIVKILPDDVDGLRHQRMLVAVEGGTILIAHNIDVADRIMAKVGDAITFKGIYIWNERGGVVHWTHRDPSGRHPGGWAKVNGLTFQ